EHEPALFVVPAGGGTPLHLGETVRIVNTPSPRPQLRWSPDGTTVSALGFAAGRPEVFGIPVSGGEPQQLTRAPEGVVAYEWSPDGKSLAFITMDSLSADEERRRADKSFIVRAGAADRALRLAVQRVDRPGALQIVTPPTQYVDALSWSPDGREIAYSAAPRTGFSAAYDARVYVATLESGKTRTIVDRPGMNTGPRFSPDGASIAFISTGGKNDIMAPRGLYVVNATGGTPRVYAMDDAWVNEYVWA